MAMTKNELSLLLYLETCLVDKSGRVNPLKINTDDRKIMDLWKAKGFIRCGRIVYHDCNKDGSLWVAFSNDAWAAAHAERRARSDRLLAERNYETTDERHAAIADEPE